MNLKGSSVGSWILLVVKELFSRHCLAEHDVNLDSGLLQSLKLNVLLLLANLPGSLVASELSINSAQVGGGDFFTDYSADFIRVVKSEDTLVAFMLKSPCAILGWLREDVQDSSSGLVSVLTLCIDSGLDGSPPLLVAVLLNSLSVVQIKDRSEVCHGELGDFWGESETESGEGHEIIVIITDEFCHRVSCSEEGRRQGKVSRDISVFLRLAHSPEIVEDVKVTHAVSDDNYLLSSVFAELS